MLRAFENRMLREIFGPKKDEVRRNWRILQNEELNFLYSAPPIIRVIKSRRISFCGACSRYEREMRTGFWWDDLR